MPQRLKLKEHQQLPYLTVLREIWFILPVLRLCYGSWSRDNFDVHYWPYSAFWHEIERGRLSARKPTVSP